jgi:hypothetical protein
VKVFVEAVDLYTPGIPDWESMKLILRGLPIKRNTEEPSRYKPTTLPRNESRRATELIRLAFRLLERVKSCTEIDISQIPSVFASSGGDYDVIHKICSALVRQDKSISPIDFHNSVHNAASGYWSIATNNHYSSISLSAYENTFPVALVESSVYCTFENKPTLLVAYDIPAPEPLSQVCSTTVSFGTVLLLTPAQTPRSIASLEIEISQTIERDTPISCKEIEGLPRKNPIARSLNLLEALTKDTDCTVVHAGNPGAKIRVRNFERTKSKRNTDI